MYKTSTVTLHPKRTWKWTDCSSTPKLLILSTKKMYGLSVHPPFVTYCPKRIFYPLFCDMSIPPQLKGHSVVTGVKDETTGRLLWYENMSFGLFSLGVVLIIFTYVVGECSGERGVNDWYFGLENLRRLRKDDAFLINSRTRGVTRNYFSTGFWRCLFSGSLGPHISRDAAHGYFLSPPSY